MYKTCSLHCTFFSFSPVNGVISNFLTVDFGFNRSGGFLDLETDTNPIDRSVAHLLFHRPSDPSLMPAGGNTLPLKSHKLVSSLTFQFSSCTVWNRITSSLRSSVSYLSVQSYLYRHVILTCSYILHKIPR